MKFFSEKFKDYLSIISIIVIIFFIWYIYWNLNNRNTVLQWFGRDTQKYEFISSLLSCPQSSAIQDSRNVNLESKLQDFIQNNNLNSGYNHISLYFRDLNNGYRFWFNEKEVFTPASLTKVPTLIAVLKKSESQKDLIYQSTKYSLPQVDYQVHYKPKYEIESDKVYTIKQLLEYMIKFSDNNATQILRNVLWSNRFEQTYKDLAISNSGLNTIKVLDYASFFRVLYNASYLNKSNSEFALNLLSQLDFKNWLPSWVPENIKVAHKFWEYSINWTVKQLHDCGIVYYPNHPYLICIMTRWTDYEELEWILSQTSKLVFTEVNQTYNEIK